MEGLTLLMEAHAAGLRVTAQGDRLVIRGPRRAEAIARRLIEHKSLVLALLTPISPDALPPEWRFRWEERAAIMEYDGGFTPERADFLALVDILGQMGQTPISFRQGQQEKKMIESVPKQR